VAGRLVLLVLLLLAVITGSLAGLTLVYSVDLPRSTTWNTTGPLPRPALRREGPRHRLLCPGAARDRRLRRIRPRSAPGCHLHEDKSFTSHWGINVFRVVGAAWHDIRSHGRAQGASTLTMQLARNLFLSSERTSTRKIQEAYLSIQIERAFTKEQIFTLYGNQIYLGTACMALKPRRNISSQTCKRFDADELHFSLDCPRDPVAFSPLLYPEKALRAPQFGC